MQSKEYLLHEMGERREERRGGRWREEGGGYERSEGEEKEADCIRSLTGISGTIGPMKFKSSGTTVLSTEGRKIHSASLL